jgi:ribosomal protein S18 acetylase RimI-like enzyme
MAVPLAGVADRGLYRAVCRDALAEKSPVSLMLCIADGKPAGFGLSVCGEPHFWRKFALRHPLISAAIAVKRLNMMTSATQAHPEPAEHVADMFEPGPSPFNWSESGPRIAKILYGGVAPEHRNGRLAFRLLASVITALEARGITRIDARTPRGHNAMIRLFSAFGFHLYPDGEDVFCVRISGTENERGTRKEWTHNA